MNDKIIWLEIFGSFCTLFFFMLVIKTTKSFLRIRNIDDSSLLMVSRNNLKKVLISIFETPISRKSKTSYKHSNILEYISLAVLVAAALLITFQNEISAKNFLYMVASFIFVSIGILLVLDLVTKGWKNTDLVIIYFLKSYLSIFVIFVVSKLFLTQNTLILFIDLALTMWIAGTTLKDISFTTENEAEETIVEINLLAQFILIAGYYLALGTLFGSEHYLIEVLGILFVSLLIYTWMSSKGQRMGVKTLAGSTSSYMISLVVVYIALRGIFWIL